MRICNNILGSIASRSFCGYCFNRAVKHIRNHATRVPLSHRVFIASRKHLAVVAFLRHCNYEKVRNLTCSPQRILITMNVRDLPFDFDLESRKDCREMIRYICDLCQCEIDPRHESSYVVQMEVYAAPSCGRSSDRRRSRSSRRLRRSSRTLRRIRRRRRISWATTLIAKNASISAHTCCKQFLQDPLGRACRTAIRNEQAVAWP